MELKHLVTSLAMDYYKWDCYIDGTCCVSTQPIFLSQSDYEEITAIARAFHQLIRKTIRMVIEDPALMRFFGFSRVERQALCSDAGHPERYESRVARFDFFKTYEGLWKIAEFNTDVPGGEPEAVGLNELLYPLQAGCADPNRILQAIQGVLVGGALGKTVAILYATGFAEDLQVAQLIRNFLIRRGVAARLGSPANLRLRNGRAELFGEPVDVVYRYFPTEWLSALDPRPRQEFIEICAHEVEHINPFAQIICQNKKISAFWWKKQALFTPVERELIRKHVPRTRKFAPGQRADFQREPAAWVLKRAHGRMGEQVLIGDVMDEAEWAVALSEIAEYEPDQWTVQEYFRAEPVVHEGEKMFPCYGVYVIGGEVAGLYTRLSKTPRTTYDALNVATFIM